MKKEDYNSIIEKLDIEISDNNKKMKIFDYKRRLSGLNQKLNRSIVKLVYGLIPLFVLEIISGLTLGALGVTSGIVLSGVSTGVVLSSIGIGSMIFNKLAKKSDIDIDIKNFCTASSEDEKYIETFTNYLEGKKLKAKNEVLEIVRNNFNEEQDMVEKVSRIYEINDKSDDSENKSLESIENELAQEFKKLDKFITKKELINNYGSILDKKYRRLFSAISVMLAGDFTMLFGNIINVCANVQPSLISVIATFGVGAVGGFLYKNQINKYNLSAFNSINNSLGDDAIDVNIDNYEELKCIEKDITNLKNRLVKMKIDEVKLNSNHNSRGDETLNNAKVKDARSSVYANNLSENIECPVEEKGFQLVKKKDIKVKE